MGFGIKKLLIYFQETPNQIIQTNIVIVQVQITVVLKFQESIIYLNLYYYILLII